jgi:hypothetical protein
MAPAPPPPTSPEAAAAVVAVLERRIDAAVDLLVGGVIKAVVAPVYYTLSLLAILAAGSVAVRLAADAAAHVRAALGPPPPIYHLVCKQCQVCERCGERAAPAAAAMPAAAAASPHAPRLDIP